ncbi:MAG: Arc/MetJ family transcription regulator, partial [Planctomycetota bacterium]
MSKLDDVLTKCKDQMTKQGIEIDETLLANIAKALGPSIYNA